MQRRLIIGVIVALVTTALLAVVAFAATSTTVDVSKYSVTKIGTNHYRITYTPWVAPSGPTAAFTVSPTSPVAGSPTTFDASSSTCPNAPCSYTWTDVGSAGNQSWALGTGKTLQYTFSDAGTKYVQLKVTDAGGASATVEHNVVVTGSSPPPPPPPPGNSCFSSPGSCGYPDPAIGNVGVPAGTTLTPSGGLNVTTAGTVINGLDVTGSINIAANNVTVENTRVTLNGAGCGTTTTCGNYEIRINEGVTGTVIKDSEVRVAPGTTCEHDIRNTSGPDLLVQRVYMHGCDSNLYGGATLQDDYGIAKLDISTDHVENIYFDNGTLNLVHDTLLNPIGQTAVVFGNVNAGAGGVCVNHLSITNSLLAGGGYTLYPCAAATSPGSSSMTVTGNRFARCGGGAEVPGSNGQWLCSGGADSHGYYPRGGAFGLDAYVYCPPTNGNVWSNNVWDDNGLAIGC